MDDTEAAAAVPAAAAASALPLAGAEESKRGVLYIARVPPFMKPAKVRHLLEAVGPTDRIYLVPEGETQLLASCWLGLRGLVCCLRCQSSAWALAARRSPRPACLDWPPKMRPVPRRR